MNSVALSDGCCFCTCIYSERWCVHARKRIHSVHRQQAGDLWIFYGLLSLVTQSRWPTGWEFLLLSASGHVCSFLFSVVLNIVMCGYVPDTCLGKLQLLFQNLEHPADFCVCVCVQDPFGDTPLI